MKVNDIGRLLKEIQSQDIESVYCHIYEKAIEWVTAGFVQEANNLLEHLWSLKLPHSRECWLSDQGLQIVWELQNKQPAMIPFQFVTVTEIEKENWERLFSPMIWHSSFTDQFIDTPLHELSGRKLFAKAIIMANQLSSNPESLPDILGALERCMNAEDCVGYSFFHAACCATMLAARYHMDAAAEKYLRLWGNGYQLYWTNYSLSYLLRDRSTAKLLISGILAPVFGLSKELCVEQGTVITAALSERIANGRNLVYAALSWNELLKKISVSAIEQNVRPFPSGAVASKWLGRSAASAAAIEAAESRLGLPLPGDYKYFLQVSNGFEAISVTHATIAPVEEIDWLVKADPQMVEIWTNAMEGVDNVFCDGFRNSILVGGKNEEQQLLLVPIDNSSWECWFFANWAAGETKYPTFRYYMEEQMQSLEDGYYS